ncbi:MAG TPA: ParB/RepB/Spo0J family partition protein [Polyangiaceae bacterium]|nr:ParB/RepB/Spo0J family partition protein [Polyangiaceae bacterium]
MSGAGKPPRGLGRGLDVLLPTRKEPVASTGQTYGKGNVFECPIEKIVPQKGQPRQHFDKERLEELARSIREHGLIEPLVVRKRGEEYELIAGERRWRAAQRAGLREVMVVVRDVSAKNAFELALIENIQREDLNAIEFAEALQRLIDEHGYTQESIAERMGKDRSTVANALRLLKLPEKVRKLVVSGELSEGHARALLGAPDEASLAALAEKVATGRLSVRQTEALVRGAKDRKAGTNGASGGPKTKTPAVRDLESRLTRKLGTKCEVRDKDGKGEIVVQYSSLDELDRLLETLL